jgi:D-alanine-D-alanine ligase
MMTVAVLFGGRSSEHDVSCASARAVAAHLDASRFEVILLGADRVGRWHRVADVDDLARATGGTLFPDLENVDVVFPVLHGRFGEDGTVQGLLELAGIPYVGCGVLASALAMDKRLASRMLAAAGIPIVETVSVSRSSRFAVASRSSHFGFPLFVKPNRAGSSVGASRVDRSSSLAAALEAALAEDDRALVQPLVDGDEVDVGILELPDGRLIAGAPLRIRPASDRPFFDYSSKYSAGGAEFEVPAALDPGTAVRLIELAERAFRAIGCAGLARVDFFVRSDGEVVLNEVNTMPGLTAHSQFPRMFRAIGMTFPELLSTLVDRALMISAAGDPARESARSAVAQAAST